MWNYLASDGQHPVETKIQQNFVLKTKYIKTTTKKISLQQLKLFQFWESIISYSEKCV